MAGARLVQRGPDLRRSSIGSRALGALAAFGLSAGAFGCSTDAPRPPIEPPEDSERFPCGATTNDLLFGSKAFTMSLANATRDHEALFFSGNSFFNSAWVEAPSSTTARDGLGPLFNARNCSACHFEDGRGSPPLAEGDDFVGVLFRIGTGERGAHGAPEPDPVYGDQIQPFALSELPGEAKPRVKYEVISGEYADGEKYELISPHYRFEDPAYGELSPGLRVSPRAAPMMIGLGLLEAVSDSDLEALADPEDVDGDGISGKINRVWDHERGEKRVGRFGWKAEQPTIRQQAAGAFLGDMGLSTSLFPGSDCTSVQETCLTMPTGGKPEVQDETFERVVMYSRMLAVPQRQNVDDEDVLLGRGLFRELGCASCHVPTHTTGKSDLEEVEKQKIWPYTDLLLHDLGPSLGDDRPAFEAAGDEWRTAPLWGIGRIEQVNGHNRLLHDGRARGVAEAILWHGGEAEAAREAFRHLSGDERKALVSFVESL
jgi:CxxC motif-containing protein (DUF1111 family)